MRSKGQAFAAFQILQGAALAVTMLVIIVGVLYVIESHFYVAGPFSVSKEVLSSAFASAGGAGGISGEMFSRSAKILEEEYDAEDLRIATGLPAGTAVTFVCNDNPRWCGDETSSTEIKFDERGEMYVCAICDTPLRCKVEYRFSSCVQQRGP